jgi:probable HAF family extracellular repeat protein
MAIMSRLHLSRIAALAALAVGAGVPAAAVAAAPASAAATTYTITDLGSLGGGVTHGLAINASGQVTGDSVTSQLVQVPCPPQKYGQPKKCFTHPDDAFVWSNGTMTDLGTLGGNYSQGVAINGSGEVVGGSATKSSGPDEPFLWNGHSMKALSAPAEVYGINDSGQIAGQCRDSMLLQGYACVVSNGTITALPESNPDIECLYINTIIPATIPAAVALNNIGQVLGNCFESAGGLAVVWTNDTPTVLPTLGGVASSGTAISGNGQVVGTSETSTGAEDGFLWSNGKLTDLGSNFSPAAVNDSGVIVGGQFVYNGTLQNLNNLIPAGSPYQIQSATGINDNGQIIANAEDTVTGQTHALLLTPN